MIRIENLTKVYGDKVAVDQLNLSIKKGEVFGLLGPNGAGKSTTILMILGLSEPTSGSVHVGEHNSTTSPIEVKKRVGYLPDQVGFYDNRTGLDNIIITGMLNGLTFQEAKERAKKTLIEVGLKYAINQKAGTYSRGMKQRLGLADVLMKKPEVIILDEPTLGIDPMGVQELLKLIRHLSKELGITVLLSSHQLQQVQQICDRVGLFVQGQLLAEGNIESLAKQLMNQEGHRVHMVTSGLHDRLMKTFNNREGIKNIQKISDTEVTFTIADKRQIQTIIELVSKSDVTIESFHQQQVGLDEIYQSYFKEGEEV